jgi:hypothetical protein
VEFAVCSRSAESYFWQNAPNSSSTWMPGVGGACLTDTLEGVALTLPKVDKDKCPICERAPHPDRATTDKKEGKGCLKSIPANLGCAPIPQNPALPNYATAAHHIIPANQCLKAFGRLSQMCNTVGYDVNNSANGMPLPTCGQKTLNAYVNEDGRTVKFRDLDNPDKVAFLIMEGVNKQWHVGHHNWSMDFTTDGQPHQENYDKLVKTKLRDLEKDIQQEGDLICDPPDESESGAALISELNSLSGEIGAQVTAWTLYYVSARSYRFALVYRK